jgi:hypothetical protein
MLIRKTYVLEENLFQRRYVRHKSQGNWQAFFILSDLYISHGWLGRRNVIATRHELDSPRIEFIWGRDFPRPSRPVLGPIQSSVKLLPGFFFPGIKQTGRGVIYQLAEAEESVEL